MFLDQYYGIKTGTDPKMEVYRKEIQFYIYFFLWISMTKLLQVDLGCHVVL